MKTKPLSDRSKDGLVTRPRHPLHRVFVEVQQMRHCPIAKERGLFDHGLDGAYKLLLQLGLAFGASVVHGAPGNPKPLTQLDQADLNAVLFQSMLRARIIFRPRCPAGKPAFSDT